MGESNQSEINRRGFLKAAAVTAVAATATGTGAALIKQANQEAVTTITTVPAAPTLSVPPLDVNNAGAESFAQLASVQAENVRLQAALDAANRQLAGLQQHDANALAANQSIQTELGAANEQIGVLAGLVALYEQLEDIDLDTVLDNGLTAVNESLANLLDDLPTLEEGLAAGQLALAEVEDHIPVLENGRVWLDGQLGKLETYFQQVEYLLIEAVEAAGPFLQMLEEWFAGVKKWLPFGIGERAAHIMQSITTLIIETPGTVSGINNNIAQPLDVWLAKDEQNEVKLNSKLIKPLRENVMVKTNETMNKTRQVETTYATHLREPAATAVANKQSIRDLIAAYREQHQI